MPVLSPHHKPRREVLTPPLSTKATPGQVKWSSPKQQPISNHFTRMASSGGDFNTPQTPCRTQHQTPRPQWSLPRAHYTTYTYSPSSESEASDVEDDDDDLISDDDNAGKIPTAQGFTYDDDDKENLSIQHGNIQSLQRTKPTTKTGQFQKQSIGRKADIHSSKQQLPQQECYDEAMEIMCSDAFSAISGGSETPSGEDDDEMEEQPIPSESFANQDEDSVQYSSNEVEVAQSPNESTTSLDYNYEGEYNLSPLPQQHDMVVVRTPMPSLAQRNIASSEASSAVVSSAATDLFAALRTTCSTVCGGENDEDLITEDNHHLSPIHHPQEACLTAERKRWIHKTLLSKREYTPYQTKEREECCKNMDSHELTTERKKWIEETLLTNPMAYDMMRKLSPKQTHGSLLPAALTEASNELFAQQQWQEEELTLDAARDDSSVASPMNSPHQQLDSSFLASALVATNMLLTPPRREKYSTKPSRPRMSIGATPLPFASPFSPSSAASSAFTEPASNIILHAIKKLTPKSSAKRVMEKQKKITPSRKSDLLSIVAEMDYFDTAGSRDRKDDEEDRSRYSQTKLVERVERLEQLITGQYSPVRDSRQDEINELRSELQKTKQQLDNERKLVEEANQRASMLMSDLRSAEEKHSEIEMQLREKIQGLEAEVDCLKDSQVDSLMDNQEQFTVDEEQATTESVASNEHADLDCLPIDSNELVESEGIAEIKHSECNKDIENTRSQLLALSTERSERVQLLTSALENLGSVSESSSSINEKLEQEHSECKKDNENTRSQLLALSTERSERVQLLTSALENLESVTESYSSINQKLEQEVNVKKDEVNCLQRSLELLSCELLESTNEVIDLQSENARLHDELKLLSRFKASKKWQEFWLR